MQRIGRVGKREAALPRCAGVMVVPSLRRPASRCRGTWRPPAGAQLHCTPARRDPRRPSNLTFVAVPHLKRNTSRRPPSALSLCIDPHSVCGLHVLRDRRFTDFVPLFHAVQSVTLFRHSVFVLTVFVPAIGEVFRNVSCLARFQCEFAECRAFVSSVQAPFLPAQDQFSTGNLLR